MLKYDNKCLLERVICHIMLLVNPPNSPSIYSKFNDPSNIFARSVVHISDLLINSYESESAINNRLNSFTNLNYPLLNRESNLPYDSDFIILVPNIFNQIPDDLLYSKPINKNVSLFNLSSELRDNNAIAALIKFTNGFLGFAITNHWLSDIRDKKYAVSLYLNETDIQIPNQIKHWVTAEIVYFYLTRLKIGAQSRSTFRYEFFEVNEKDKYGSSGIIRHRIKRAYYPNEFECDICLDPTGCPGAAYIKFMEINNIDYSKEQLITIPDKYTINIPDDFVKHEPMDIIQLAPVGINTVDSKRQKKLDTKIRSAWKLNKETNLHEFLGNYASSTKYTIDPDSFKRLIENYEKSYDANKSLNYFVKQGRDLHEHWLDIDISKALILTKSEDIKQLKRKLPRKTDKSDSADKIKVKIITRNPKGKHDKVLALYNSLLRNDYFTDEPMLQMSVASIIAENKNNDCFNKLFDLVINHCGGYNKINKRLAKLIDNSSVYMALHSPTLVKLLVDQEHEIKSGVEVGPGSGADPMGSQRLQIEVLRMQSDLNDYNTLKKYGFISTKNYPLVDGRIKQYGSIVLEFHDYVKERTTITFGDSFGAFTQPIPMLNPDIKLLMPGIFYESHGYGGETSLTNFVKQLDNMRICLNRLMKRSMLRQGLNIAGMINSGYVEAQVNGKLTLENVKTIHIQSDKVTQIYRDSINNPHMFPEHIHFAMYLPRNYSEKLDKILYSHIKRRRPALKS